MIEITKARVMNFDGALRGMRNPKDSWDRSDSTISFIPNKIEGKDANGNDVVGTIYLEQYNIGPNDLKLAMNLDAGGSVHRKFMRQILVSVDIDAPLYWWKEFDTYKVATVANSCSTMHKIQAYPITLDRVSNDHLRPHARRVMEQYLEEIENIRHEYLETNNKDAWYDMIQMLPSSWNQKRTVTFNYETLVNIYTFRHNHKLEEWRTFCDWIATLPYAQELIINTAMNEINMRTNAQKWVEYVSALNDVSNDLKACEDDATNQNEENMAAPKNVTPDSLEGKIEKPIM